jgi:nitroimidazol reductase NimA-like FMN-containing flavoprotein (pyridoxamine 5'-phosphate oxidase superfamily)
MAGKEPKAEQAFEGYNMDGWAYSDAGKPAPWDEARKGLAAGDSYWLSTVRPDGRPHAVPVLAVWVDGALHFSAGPATRKARNLTRDPHCVITTSSLGIDFMVEGSATQILDDAKLQEVANAFATKYGWRPTARDGALQDIEGAPTAGSPPYNVYEVSPTVVFGLPAETAITPTRWLF